MNDEGWIMFFSYPVFRPKSPPDCLWPQSVRTQVERRAGAGLRIMNYAAHAVRLSRGGGGGRDRRHGIITDGLKLMHRQALWD